MAPVLLGGVKEDMEVWQEEAFASLAACMMVNSDEEAIRIANSSGYGLSAAVFTEDLRKGLAIAKKIQSGSVSLVPCQFLYNTDRLQCCTHQQYDYS
jgi:acyl-CoA reductase-like NAD-dependent aldehyde dehydrogenase